MSDLKREWKPCEICKKYYDYSCENISDIKNCKKFIPENSFKNFLAKNYLKIINSGSKDLDIIYFINKEISIKNLDCHDLRGKSFENIKEILHYGEDFIHCFILNIDDKTRDFIYNDDYIMSHYDIKMIIDNDVKKTLKYRLDERFNYINIEFLNKDTIL